MNKKYVLSLSAFLTFLLNLIPASAVVYGESTMNYIFSAAFFSAIYNILITLFRINEGDQNTLLLFIRLALFMSIFIFSWVLLSKEEGIGNIKFKRSQAISLALIIAYFGSILIARDTLLTLFTLYSAIFTMIGFLLPTVGIIYLNFHWFNEKFGDGTPVNLISKSFAWGFGAICFAALISGIGDFTNTGVAFANDIADTIAFWGQFFVLFFAFGAFWNLIKLFMILAGLSAVGLTGATVQLGNSIKQVKTLYEELETMFPKAKREAVSPEVAKVIEEAKRDIAPVIKAQEKVAEKMEESVDIKSEQKELDEMRVLNQQMGRTVPVIGQKIDNAIKQNEERRAKFEAEFKENRSKVAAEKLAQSRVNERVLQQTRDIVSKLEEEAIEEDKKLEATQKALENTRLKLESIGPKAAGILTKLYEQINDLNKSHKSNMEDADEQYLMMQPGFKALYTEFQAEWQQILNLGVANDTLKKQYAEVNTIFAKMLESTGYKEWINLFKQYSFVTVLNRFIMNLSDFSKK